MTSLPERACLKWMKWMKVSLLFNFHTILARRCAQDMVEVPSHLWEHFVTDPRTLRMLARSTSGDPLPDDLCEQVRLKGDMLPGWGCQDTAFEPCRSDTSLV